MPTLRELQQAVADAVLGDGDPAFDSVLASALLVPERVRIHRNHFYSTLCDALQATYPVVCRLVGERFFRQAARGYIRVHPPAGPCLFEFGGRFGGFLHTYEPGRRLPYLPDVARLEWALNEAYHAPDAPTLEREALTELGPEAQAELTLDLHPACRFVASPYPIDRIWRANQPGADPDETIDLAEGGARLLVRRSNETVEFATIGAGDFAFLEAVARGRPLGVALERAGAAQPDFDAADSIARLAAAGVFARSVPA